MPSVEDFFYSFVRYFSHLLNSTYEIHTLFKGTVSYLQKAIGVRAALLSLLDEERRLLAVREVFGRELQALRGDHFSLGERLGEVLLHQHPSALQDLSSDPLLGRFSARLPSSKSLFIWSPLSWLGHPLGLLGTYHPSPPWEEDLLIEVMGTISSLLSPPLAAMSLWEEQSLDEIIQRKLETTLMKVDEQVERGANLMAEILSLVERSLIGAALRRTGGVQVAASQLLGINRNTLRKKIIELGIKFPQPSRRYLTTKSPTSEVE